MSEKDNRSATTSTKKRRRNPFEILLNSLDYAGDINTEIEVTYTIRYHGITIHNLRELMHFDGTWPDESAEEIGCTFAEGDGHSASSDGKEPLMVTLTERAQRQIRAHLHIWLLRLYARLLQVFQPESDYTEAIIKEMNAGAKAMGCDWPMESLFTASAHDYSHRT